MTQRQPSPDNGDPILHDIAIVPFQPDNQAEVQRLILAGLTEHWGQLDPTKNPDLNDIGATYAHATFLVAWFHGTIVGTGALMPRSAHSAEIVRMSVAAHLRRHGIGRRVVCTSDRYRRTDLPFVNDAERSRALHTSLSRTSHMDQNLERLIRERAYEIWASRGCVHGQANQHWLAAEREILTAPTAAFAGKAAPQKKRPLPARSKITKTLARSG